MLSAVVLGASALGATVGATLPRLAYRWSVSAGSPRRYGCELCGARFRSGLKGWGAFGNRCGNCGRSLGPAWQPLSGLLAAASGALAWRLAPMTANDLVLLAVWLLLACAGFLLACIDVAVRRLPTPIVLATAAALVGFVVAAAVVTRRPWMLVNSLAAGAVLGLVYLLLALLGGGMGMGDVRLAGVLGLALGTAGWTAVLLGAVLPYLLAAPIAVTRLRRDPRESLAFGPYLVTGAILAVCLTGS